MVEGFADVERLRGGPQWLFGKRDSSSCCLYFAACSCVAFDSTLDMELFELLAW